VASQLFDEMMGDEGFRQFMKTHSTSLDVEDVLVEAEPSTIQMLELDKRLADATEMLEQVNAELANTRQELGEAQRAFQELVEGKAWLQGLEGQVLRGLLKELGLTG
jgi:hypothetical protein